VQAEKVEQRKRALADCEAEVKRKDEEAKDALLVAEAKTLREAEVYMLQCAAVCCSVLQCVAVCCSVLLDPTALLAAEAKLLHVAGVCLALSCRVLQCSSVLQFVTVCSSVLQVQAALLVACEEEARG